MGVSNCMWFRSLKKRQSRSSFSCCTTRKKSCCENLTKCMKSLYHIFWNLSSSLPVSKTIKMKITVLTVVVYGCETWSLKPVWKHRRTVFESRMLRENIGTQTDEVAGSWSKLYSEELYDFTPHPIRFGWTNQGWDGMGRAFGCMGEERTACRVLVGTKGGQRLHGRPGHRWQDNIPTVNC